MFFFFKKIPLLNVVEKKVILQISQNLQKKHLSQSLVFPAQMVLCDFREVSHKTSFKKSIRWLLLQKLYVCLASRHDRSSFQKRCHTYFPSENSLGFVCRLRTRVNSIFETLSQKLDAYFQPSQTSVKELFLQKWLMT